MLVELPHGQTDERPPGLRSIAAPPEVLGIRAYAKSQHPIGTEWTVTYTPRPRPSFVDDLEKLPRSGPARWRDREDNLYEYDGTHCELEVFNSRGRHIGVADILTGDIIKPARKGRNIDV
ncbi:colicin E3/pyocin S6 family cytotoxin [Jatrophihabitans sp. GAS493]|uniref:colicin E3/pyocin S6 family cytotoxin n=1 Tax=Jatrophihabitans sp. GAS493 TaxID=1907575 RepID=UPI000BB90422